MKSIYFKFNIMAVFFSIIANAEASHDLPENEAPYRVEELSPGIYLHLDPVENRETIVALDEFTSKQNASLRVQLADLSSQPSSESVEKRVRSVSCSISSLICFFKSFSTSTARQYLYEPEESINSSGQIVVTTPSVLEMEDPSESYICLLYTSPSPRDS